jgi:hypothetical protein
MRFQHLAGLVAASISATAPAQSTGSSVIFPSGWAPGQSPCVKQSDGTCAPVSATTPLPIASKQESFRLVSANTPSAAATVFGGDYILSQTCAAYGTLNLQVLGPDGAVYATVLTKTASDAGGGTSVALGSYAMVRVTVTGTTTCNAILARVPA